jgi:hypothetical protein
MIVFCQDAQREPLLVDASTARFLEFSDGTRTVSEILRQLQLERGGSGDGDELAWVENLFRLGLIWLLQVDATKCLGRDNGQTGAAIARSINT